MGSFLGCRAPVDVIFSNVEGIDSCPFLFQYSRPFCESGAPLPAAFGDMFVCHNVRSDDVANTSATQPHHLTSACLQGRTRSFEAAERRRYPKGTVAPCHSAPLSLPGPLKAASSHCKRRPQEWHPATRVRGDTAVKLLCYVKAEREVAGDCAAQRYPGKSDSTVQKSTANVRSCGAFLVNPAL
jgi:hypothetical protein